FIPRTHCGDANISASAISSHPFADLCIAVFLCSLHPSDAEEFGQSVWIHLGEDLVEYGQYGYKGRPRLGGVVDEEVIGYHPAAAGINIAADDLVARPNVNGEVLIAD